MIRKLLPIVLASSATYASCAMANEGVKQPLDSVNIQIKGNVLAESCTTVTESGKDISYDFGRVPLRELTKVGTDVLFDIYPDKDAGRIEFVCDQGSYANFSLSYVSPVCTATNSLAFACGGQNTSVGMVVAAGWTDKDNVTIKGEFFNHTPEDNNAINTLKLDSDFKGSIDALKILRFRPIRDRVVEPGPISIDLLLKIWAP